MTITITVPNLTELRRSWKSGLLVLLALALTLTWGGAPGARGAHLAPIVGTTVPVGTDPRAVGVNATTDRVYVANAVSNDVSVIDGATNAVVATVPVGSFPAGVGVNAATDRVYVANNGSNDVSVIADVTSPQINITNLGQYGLANTCFELVDELALFFFTVCDNDFQGPTSHPACDDGTDTICNDEDPADGLIRVTTVTGDYSVAVSKPAVNHTVDPSKQPCVAVPAGKCELTFVNAPNSRPWFPWDLPEPKLNIEPDGNVNIIDIGIIVRHFLDKKPLP